MLDVVCACLSWSGDDGDDYCGADEEPGFLSELLQAPFFKGFFVQKKIQPISLEIETKYR